MSKTSDLDLMLLADGEAGPAAQSPAATPLGADARAKIEGIREVGELVRTHLELSADEAEPRLAGLWDLVERRLDAEERAVAPAAVAAPAPGAWARFTGWLARHRAQLVTGALTAGAAAGLVWALRPAPKVVTRYVQLPVVPVPGPGSQVGPGDQRLVSDRPAEVESLDVSGGTGAVFTIEDDDGETTVIWVTPDEVEGT